ncbi:MAG: macro domain-containing protein [Hyphomonadaceae bacterium]
MSAELQVIVARIEHLALDAIVNPANRELLPGGGADGAIRAAAGPALNDMLARHGPLPESGALLTPGFRLPARFIIHTAAPIWRAPGDEDEKIAALAHCYRACLDCAAEARLAALAFPALGTGIYGWPKELACRIAVETVRGAARAPARVVFCCFTDDDADIYRAELGR